MIKVHFVTAIRNLRKFKAFTFISFAGYTAALTICTIVFLWISEELQINNFLTSKNVYQLMVNMHGHDEIRTLQTAPKPLAKIFPKEVAGVEEFEIVQGWNESHIFKKDDKELVMKGRPASNGFLELFQRKILVGNTKSIEEPNTILVSDQVAERLYGTDWKKDPGVVGSFLKMDHDNSVKVVGVFESFPKNSTIKLDYVVPFVSEEEYWSNFNFNMYFTLSSGVNIADINNRIKDLINDHRDEGSKAEIFGMSFNKTYLYSNFENGKSKGGRIEYIRTFMLVSFFLLLLACINFTNLSTSLALVRAREVGIRKVMGASNIGIFLQFITETLLVIIFASGATLVTVLLLLPYVNDIVGIDMVFEFSSVKNWLFMAGLILVTWLISGIYPSIYTSSLGLIQALKGNVKFSFSSIWMRKSLVGLQLIVANAMIILAISAYYQVDHLLSKELGYDRERVIVKELSDEEVKVSGSIKSELVQYPGVQSVVTSSSNLLSAGARSSGVQWPGKDPNNHSQFIIISADHDFLKMMGVSIVSGRHFSYEFTADKSNFIINKDAADLMNVEDPVNMTIELWGEKGKIVGVMDNINLNNPFSPVEPLIVRCRPDDVWLLLVKAETGRLSDAISALNEVHMKFSKSVFEYSVIDEDYKQMFTSEIVLEKISHWITIFVVLITSLGLYGLASFSTETRRKEVGIRKILGSSSNDILVLFYKPFLPLLLITTVLSSSLVYALLHMPFNQVINVDSVSSSIFVVSSLLVALVVILTIAYHMFRISRINVVDNLRQE